ncbi:hypothetical protein FNBNMHLP_00649 [Aeromonas jandaei]
MAAHCEKGSPIHILLKRFNSERLSQNTAFVVSEYRPRGGGISDHWDDNFNQEKAPPDFLVEREDVVGEGALADQLAKLADLYISKLQGNRMAGLADLGEDLLKLAEIGIRDGSSSCAGLVKELCRRTG